MNKFKIDRLKQTARRIQKRLTRRKALILMYHRIAEVDVDPWSLCVAPQHFAEQLQVLKQYANPISLQQLAQSYQAGTLPHRSIALTFDDGYADNLHQAKPLLEQYNIPATVFVSTGYIGHDREFWWDELEQLLLNPGKLPEMLSLTINGNTREWTLGTAADYSKADYQRDRHRQAWTAQPGSRLFFYYCIWQWLQHLQNGDRLEALNQIAAWVGAEPTVRPSHRALSHEELCVLGQGHLVEIGAHTVTHPYLSSQSVALQQDEIQRSKASLEKSLNCLIPTFSYPFGDHNTETVTLTQAAGFVCACSTVEDVVWQKTSCFQLPRFGVENWNGKVFANQLSRWFHD